MTRYLGVILVALLAAGCGSSAKAADPAPDPASTTTAPAPTTPNELERALRTYGVDLGGAPAGTAQLDGARFCGAETQSISDEKELNDAARRCFLEANGAKQPAVFVKRQYSIEGDPLVTIYRSDDAGRVGVLIDSTRDKFGSGTWAYQQCTGLTTDFPDAPAPLPPNSFEATGCAETGARG